jgi:glycerol-3-phosphate O-acyltransferase
MFAIVEIPVWLLTLILLFAAVTASTHLLFPSVRWFFRRRAERLVAELNKRLERPIQPFKLLRRQDMIQRVIYDPDVVRAVGDYADETGVREDVAFEKARDYAREIVPSFSATAYYGFAIRISRWVSNKLFDVRLHRIDDEALSRIDSGATVVFVMNHRSNFDYLLVTYLAADHAALSYAAGEWARVWPLSRVVRAMGAYFIRRKSRTALYRRVLATYVQKATEAGVTQAVFPEGGLSRSGMVGTPKLGILSYMVQGWQADDRDVVFVPVSLNYDRIVEDRILVAAGRSGSNRFRATAPEGVRFTLRYIWRRFRGRVGRFGVAAVTFGRPVSLQELYVEHGTPSVELLAERLVQDIRANVPILTVPLALAALLHLGGRASVQAIAAEMESQRVSFPATAADFALHPVDIQALTRELDVLVLRHILTTAADGYAIDDADLAAFYAGSIRHHLSADAAKAIHLIAPNGASEET